MGISLFFGTGQASIMSISFWVGGWVDGWVVASGQVRNRMPVKILFRGWVVALGVGAAN